VHAVVFYYIIFEAERGAIFRSPGQNRQKRESLSGIAAERVLSSVCI